jgi:hypothetical protein
VDPVGKIWGNHQLKVGFELDRIRSNSFFDRQREWLLPF